MNTVNHEYRIIHIFRNGEDVVASLHKASKQWGKGYSVKKCVRRWNKEMQVSLGYLSKKNHIFVSYEYLAREPEICIKNILSNLGLQQDSYNMEKYKEASTKLIASSEVWKNNVQGEVKPSSTFNSYFDKTQKNYIIKYLKNNYYDILYSKSLK